MIYQSFIRIGTFLLLVGLLTNYALASSDSLQSILEQIRTEAAKTQDVTTEVEIKQAGLRELTVIKAFVLAPDLARYEFLAPQSLVGQINIEEGETSITYLPVTNQAIVEEGIESEVGGGLFAALDTDFANYLPDDKFSFELGPVENSDMGAARSLYATLKNPTGKIVRLELVYLEASWTPLRLTGFDSSGKELASAKFLSWETNTGLKAEALRALPEGAEIIR